MESLAKLCNFARSRFYEDKIRHMNDINPKKWWDNIKMLSELWNQQSLTSMFVNGTVLKNEQLAEATEYIMLPSNVRRYYPFGLATYPSYKCSRFVCDFAQSCPGSAISC